MQSKNSYLFFLFIIFWTSCKKKDVDANLIVGFPSDNPTSALQGTVDTFNIKIGLNSIADRDIYIKYSVDYGSFIKLLDNSYFVIKKGEQFRSIPFIVIMDKRQKRDYDLSFNINQVYNATKDNNAAIYKFKLLTNYLPTSGTGIINIDGVNDENLTFYTSYREPDAFFQEINGKFFIDVLLSDQSYLKFIFVELPSEGKTYVLTNDSYNRSTDRVFSFYQSSTYHSQFDPQPGTLKVDKIDTLNKTLQFNFNGNFWKFNIDGKVNFSRYNLY